jgi:hypothetical protein
MILPTYDIVVSRWRRNVDWVNTLPFAYVEVFGEFAEPDGPDLKTNVRILIYDKADECPANPYNVPENKGNEASVYLKYIIDHYDEGEGEPGFPDYVFFVHDEEFSWHHEGSLYDRFKEAIVLCRRFFNVNDFLMRSLFDNIYIWEILTWYGKYVEPYIPLDSLPNPDFTIGHKGAAQFMVHKEAILHLPKSFYLGLYDWVMNSGESSFVTGRFLEWTWHIFWDLHR